MLRLDGGTSSSDSPKAAGKLARKRLEPLFGQRVGRIVTAEKRLKAAIMEASKVVPIMQLFCIIGTITS
jgi:hypothetical protein